MARKILCVAEKPSIAKAVANHLGGTVQPRNVPGLPWLKNYEFTYNFSQPWGQCNVVFTSVAGHINSNDFGPEYKNWNSCPPVQMFDAPIRTFVDPEKTVIAKNIEMHARTSMALYIWTDCDREGEHIGTEIRSIAMKANSKLEVKRAKFSNIERAHIINASQHPVSLDERQANAVAARIELDLRIGAAFTRLQTLQLKSLIDPVQELKVLSYGSCQFPTLGFVVDRYFRVQNFVPEPFWYIKVTHVKMDIKVNFNWKRGHLFDRMAVIIIYERCLDARLAEVIKTQKKPTSKWKPLPLTTVELQKLGSRFLRMDSQTVMKTAEDLYTKGWISYPRTETDQFDRGIDLKRIIDKQTRDNTWGPFAQNLMNGNFRQPRNGSHNDKAHPPIHPVNHVVGSQLSENERRVYDFVVRRFLACCSEDATGEATDIEIQYGPEIFHTHGLTVLQRNYLDVYPFDKWESSQELPPFTVGETFTPTEAKMVDGKTTAPGYLTEPELIALMDANGIGTDATMAEHIAKIKERQYVMSQTKGSRGHTDNEGDEQDHVLVGRGGGRGGRGRGRGGRGGGGGTTGARAGATSGVQEFIPTTLGVALIEGYDNVGFETSLGKPFLRKEMELQMKAICEGRTTRNDVVQSSLDQYREVYIRTQSQMNVLKASIRKYILGQNG
ncbi:DNA topoisomerase [Patellaria atrata CBS 101060]|uniref:DNA topoisomerase n=1 Tax=Patellaria atrata CBS 101060 TaxID=1346257 RepID=A0A9P4S8B9_9PEZI|nr:DNA topoisomerase [Patellaria atrata CBS 101060]